MPVIKAKKGNGHAELWQAYSLCKIIKDLGWPKALERKVGYRHLVGLDW